MLHKTYSSNYHMEKEVQSVLMSFVRGVCSWCLCDRVSTISAYKSVLVLPSEVSTVREAFDQS